MRTTYNLYEILSVMFIDQTNHLGGANQNVMPSELYQSPIRWSLSEQEKWAN